jgi:hypothetical protein
MQVTCMLPDKPWDGLPQTKHDSEQGGKAHQHFSKQAISALRRRDCNSEILNESVRKTHVRRVNICASHAPALSVALAISTHRTLPPLRARKASQCHTHPLYGQSHTLRPARFADDVCLHCTFVPIGACASTMVRSEGRVGLR